MSSYTIKNRETSQKRIEKLGITRELFHSAPDIVMQRLNSLDNIGTRVMTMCHLLSSAEAKSSPHYQYYSNEYRQLCNAHHHLIGCNTTKYDDLERAKIWKQIDEVYINNSALRNDTEINRFLLASYYKHMVPRRCELGDIRLVAEMEDCDNEHNFIVMNESDPRMVLNDYKTAMHYKRYSERLSPDFYADLKKTMSVPRSTLFVSGIKSRNAFSNFVKRTLGVGVSDLRHIYITDNMKTANYNDRIKTARAMGHSVDMQMQYLYL